MNQTIVFCTTCKGRTQHLSQTLPANLKHNARAKFVVLDYNSPDDLLSYLSTCHGSDLASGRLAVYSYPSADKFHMTHAKNMAHRCGLLEGGDILVNLDADNFTGPDFDEYLVEKFRSPDMFMWSRMVKSGPERLDRGISGRIAVTRSAFLLAGGYDEKFSTWSPDDKDFHKRLLNLGLRSEEIDPRYLLAIRHNDRMRFREYPHIQGNQCYEETFQSVDGERPIVNYGNVGCGLVNKLGGPAIELCPLPTRIFGVGLHKTGTSSLHQALQILGFKSGHWENAHWAKAIWMEMQNGEKTAPALEKFYALSDLPIPLLYEKLDRQYPGSKFVLTVRDEHRWLISVANHWNHESNPHRAQWNSDPFTHMVHKALYGQKGFDADLFVRRYRVHNAAVIDYFRHRPDDLLVMDVEKGDGWQQLCPFLGVAAPQSPYPHALPTRKSIHQHHFSI